MYGIAEPLSIISSGQVGNHDGQDPLPGGGQPGLFFSVKPVLNLFYLGVGGLMMNFMGRDHYLRKPNPTMMKPFICNRALLVITALGFFVMSAAGQNNQAEEITGKWTKVIQERTITLTITSDLKFQVEFSGGEGIDVWGSCTLSGSRITFNDEGGPYSSDSPGVYEFEVSGTTATFTIVNDPVEGRSSLVKGTWSKAAKVE